MGLLAGLVQRHRELPARLMPGSSFSIRFTTASTWVKANPFFKRCLATGALWKFKGRTVDDLQLFTHAGDRVEIISPFIGDLFPAASPVALRAGLSGAWMGLWIALSLWAVPLTVLHAYAAKLASPIGIEAFIDNQSLTGLIYRCFTLNAYTQCFIDWPRFASALRWILTIGILCLRRDHTARPENSCGTYVFMVPCHDSPDLAAHRYASFGSFAHPFQLSHGWTQSDAAALVFYAFFAAFVPLWGYKFCPCLAAWSSPITRPSQFFQFPFMLSAFGFII